MEYIEPITVKPWNSLYDGYMSVAREIYTIIRNSNNFSLDNYVGQEEFYRKYVDYYASLVENFNILMKDSPLKDQVTESDLNCIEAVTGEMNRMVENKTMTLHAFLVAYVNLISFISFLREDSMIMPIPGYECLSIAREKRCQHNPSELVDNMRSYDTKVPFLSPRGVYGINVFLFLYFNKISPIGISLNPWRVHHDAFLNRTRDIISHDFQHIQDSYEFYDNQEYERLRRTYIYIINNQDTIGPPGKVQGLILFMYYIIHETGGFSDDPNYMNIIEGILAAIYDSSITDILPFLIDNTYYTPEYFSYDREEFNTIIRDKFTELMTHKGQPYEYAEEETEAYIENFFYAVLEDFLKIHHMINGTHQPSNIDDFYYK